MNIINIVFGTPFGAVIYFLYQLTNSYGLAILLFALFVRVVIFPIVILAQKNSIRLLKLQPRLNVLKRWYGGDKERLSEEQYNLFKEAGYRPLIGLVPLLIQLILLMGVLQVMYNPLQYIVRLNQEVIDVLSQTFRELTNTQGGAQEQLLIMEAIPHHLSVFEGAIATVPNGEAILQSIMNTDLQFMGFNLGATPSFLNPSLELLIPFLVLIAMLTMCIVQCIISPGAISQGRKTNLWFILSTVLILFYFTAVTPTGVGLYWIAYGLLGTVSLVLLNFLYNPKKLAGEAIMEIKKNRKTTVQLKEERSKRKEFSIREKEDAKRFTKAKKQLVFYAISGGQYKYYKEYIEYILQHSDIVIHYLTNDPKDGLFKQEIPRLIPYYAGHRKTISLMMKLDTDILVTTVPGLQHYHMKRSVARTDIEYIYTFHGLGSTHLVVRGNALDAYDTLFCVGPHHVAELRRREELQGLPPRKLIKTGFGVYDQLVELYSNLSESPQTKPKILIAPSWQEDSILDLCIEEMLDALLGHDYEIIIRPHPQYIRMFPERMEELQDKYSQNIETGEMVFDMDFLNNDSIYLSDVLVTDWSNIAFEFSYCTLKPSVFINTPMKILNPNYKEYGLDVLNITLRDKVGISVNIDEICRLKEMIRELLMNKNAYEEQIKEVVKQNLFHPGRNGEAGGKYLMERLIRKEK